MQDEQILTELTDVFRDMFADDTIVVTRALTADQVKGWDSVKHISLIVAVEDRFGITMKTSEIESLGSVGDLVDAIKAKMN